MGQDTAKKGIIETIVTGLYALNREGSIGAIFLGGPIQTYKQDDIVEGIFYSGDEQSHLNLITCQGTWNKSTKSYPDRLVIFTDKVE